METTSLREWDALFQTKDLVAHHWGCPWGWGTVPVSQGQELGAHADLVGASGLKPGSGVFGKKPVTQELESTSSTSLYNGCLPLPNPACVFPEEPPPAIRRGLRALCSVSVSCQWLLVSMFCLC